MSAAIDASRAAGIEGVRVLLGLLSLTNKHSRAAMRRGLSDRPGAWGISPAAHSASSSNNKLSSRGTAEP